MKTILFPTDFSAFSENAFVYALKIADQMQAEIATLHVYRLPDISALDLPKSLQAVYDSMDLDAFEDYRDQVPALRRQAEEAGLGHISMRHRMVEGEVVSTIIQSAREVDADLIVMGTQGATGLKEIFLGSVAGEVLENAYCPVLAVPKEASFDGQIDRIAITTSYDPTEELAMQRILEFGRQFGASVWVVNVDTGNTEAYAHRMDQLKAKYEGQPDIHFRVLEGSYLIEPVSEFLELEKIDILAMLTRRRNFMQELFNFSQTKAMAYHAKTPILSIQAHTLGED
jgi:nucleotide-binding universal stress UspA family protein